VVYFLTIKYYSAFLSDEMIKYNIKINCLSNIEVNRLLKKKSGLIWNNMSCHVILVSIDYFLFNSLVVEFTITYAIAAYHHWCEFKSCTGQGVQHYVIKFVSDLQHVSGFLRLPPPIKICHAMSFSFLLITFYLIHLNTTYFDFFYCTRTVWRYQRANKKL
jgi:hypothetical protein